MTNREKWRRAIVLIAAAMVVLLMACPPLVRYANIGGSPQAFPQGHDWVWSTGGEIEFGRLLLEIGAVAVAAGALLFVFREK